MDATNTTWDGERHELTGELVSRRMLDCEGVLVRRLTIATGDEQLALFVRSGDSLPDLRTGATYRFEGVWGCTPVAPVAGGADAVRVDHDCPTCGGRLRHGQSVDAFPAVRRAADRLGIDEPFGIIDEATRIRALDSEPRIDDWQPMHEHEPTTVPAFVCRDCGEGVEDHELRRTHEAEAPVLESSMDSMASANAAPATDTVGLATGGAKDIENFRENIREGYTPQPEAISEEGLFYDYHFETWGTASETDALFAPRYAGGTGEHPLTAETERYLAVGLDSTLAVEDFQRPRLDLVAVLDVSGSMDSPFDQYYYDEHGRRRSVDTGGQRAETKLEAAVQSLCALTEQLHDEDRLGVVLFNNRSHVAKPLRTVGETDMDAIRGHIREVAAGGGTNMADGFEAATELLADGTTGPGVERRVVFMTDAMPNVGTTGTNDLTSLFADAASEGIHTTFVGMGIDANSELVDALSGVEGANHYFVHSAPEFEQRLGDEFDYMVTPLVYDLGLELETDGYEIAAVHGSPSADAATGQLMHVGTLFPAPKEDGETRGGIVLVRIERTSAVDPSLDLVASWTERDGSEHTERVHVDLPDTGYDHDAIRKGVALTRYVRALRSWAADVHGRAEQTTGVDDWLLPDELGDHERGSVPLVVPETHADRLALVRDHLRSEGDALDTDFDREFAVLDRLLAAVDRPTESEVDG